MNKIILASTSPYRKNLLKKLAIQFEAHKPLFDEDHYASTQRPVSPNPSQWAQTLASLKAESLAGPGLTVIGADQLVSFQGQILGKPKTRKNAILQLEKMQNQTHELITAVCVLDGHVKTSRHEFVNITKLTFRKLSRLQIENYIDLDQPMDCAGSYKFECHGIGLISNLETQDPTAIEGLPLIKLATVLKECGYESYLGTN